LSLSLSLSQSPTLFLDLSLSFSLFLTLSFSLFLSQSIIIIDRTKKTMRTLRRGRKEKRVRGRPRRRILRSAFSPPIASPQLAYALISRLYSSGRMRRERSAILFRTSSAAAGDAFCVFVCALNNTSNPSSTRTVEGSTGREEVAEEEAEGAWRFDKMICFRVEEID
jgi:hypothetical protein